MAVYDVSTTEKKASPSLVAGGTLYADNPLGTILPFGGSDIPTGWLLCDGTAVSRTTYSELFAVIGESFGAGDGSTTFNLPDMRESVPKGAGLTGKTVGAHLDADGLTVGEFLDDRVQRHAHNFSITGGSGSNGAVGITSGTRATEYTTGMVAQYGTGDTIRQGLTTEVKSVGVNYIIKAKMVAIPSDFMGKVGDIIQIRKGTFTIPAIAMNNSANVEITFDKPMPNVDYVISLAVSTSNDNNTQIKDKTVDGFTIILKNVGAINDVSYTGAYTAISFDV